MLDGGIARTGADETGDGISQVSKLGELPLNRCEFLLGAFADRCTGSTLPRPERQQFFRLRQRETKACGMANKLEPGKGIFPVSPISALGAEGLWQQTYALVVPHGLDADARTFPEGPDGERPVAHANSMGAVLDYRVK